MPDFEEPEMVFSQPYGDGHKDLLLAYPTNLNYNLPIVDVPAKTLFRDTGGHCILKRVFVLHTGTVGVTVQPAIFLQGNTTGYVYLDPMVTTIADDPMSWPDLNIAIYLKRSLTVTKIARFVMTGYAATDDLILVMELEWWP